MAALKQNVVNLDALIPRADLAVGINSDNVKGVTLNTPEPGTLVYKQLRKPDFQRETANWRPEQVAQLIITFLTKDLVPAIVLWEAGPQVFVIDGAHRLSALIAWVHNDYGDGDISRGFFQRVIPRAQKIAADRTRALVNDAVGTYAEHKAENPATPEIASRAKLIAWQEIQAQWIKNADARSAEDSFFRINQGGTTIDATESRILNARGSATALAARAILRGGTGNEYWRRFDEPTRLQIEQLGSEVHKLLFAPDYDLPIKTLNLPLAGFGYGSTVLPFVFDFVNLANDVAVPDSSHKNAPKEETGYEPDPDGQITIKYLTRIRETLWRICSTHPSSLGLLPALYFYSGSGGFQPNSLLSVMTLFKGWDTPDFITFTEARKTLEDFLLSNRKTTELIRKLGSGSRSRPRLVSLYRRVLKEAKLGRTVDKIRDILSKEKDFTFLAEAAPEFDLPGGKFNRDVKATAFLNTALPNALRCPSCGGLLHNLAMQVGHKKARRDGGSSTAENAQMQHPFCNSTYAQ
jgi:5-methylcytosine-specific restriction endonuclease McrA